MVCRLRGMGDMWKAILEVSTLLGGLSAVVFFFDRFRRRPGMGSAKPKPPDRSLQGTSETSPVRRSFAGGRYGTHPPPSPPAPSLDASVPTGLLSAGATSLCFAGCSTLGVVGFKFGFSAMTGAYFGLLVALFLAFAALPKGGHLLKVVGHAWFSIGWAGGASGVLAILGNAILGGNMDLYAGSALSIFTAVFCIVLGMFFCFGLLRLNWFGEPWD